MANEIRLSPEDPTIFAKCPRCSAMGRGTKAGSQFYRAYTIRRWVRKPKCENCNTPMVKLYEVKEERREAKRTTARRDNAPVRARLAGGRMSGTSQ